jgi:hypothetical protein
MGFEHLAALTVNKIGPNSHADQLGIQVGWNIKAVNDINNNDEHRCNARAREKSLLERHEKQS